MSIRNVGIALAATAAIASAVVVGSLTSTATAAVPTATSTSSAAAEGCTGGRAGHTHTAVTGDELDKVTAAVKAKDSAVTVTRVLKDADGSYDVIGTKAGETVRLEASADLATISAATAGGRGGPGGRGSHTAVTGDELAKVTAAVKAKDSAVTVTRVLKDADGSYDVIGTKAGETVRLEASADLKTIEVDTRTRPDKPASSGSSTTSPSATGTATT